MKDEGVGLKRYRASRVRPKFSRPEVLMTDGWVALWATCSMRVAIVIVTVTWLQTHISTSPCTQVSIPDTNHSSIDESLNWFIFLLFFLADRLDSLSDHSVLSSLNAPTALAFHFTNRQIGTRTHGSLSDTLRAR